MAISPSPLAAATLGVMNLSRSPSTTNDDDLVSLLQLAESVSLHFDEAICFANILFFCHIQVNGLSNLLKSIPDKGISGDDVDILKRKNASGTNTYPRRKVKSFWVHSLSSIFISRYS